MEQGQSSSTGPAGDDDDIIDSPVTQMAEALGTQASKLLESSVASCLISWAGRDSSDRSDYEPAKVCIGPFHRLKKPDPSESMKKEALKRAFSGDEHDLKRLLEVMRNIVPRARGCYSRPFDEILPPLARSTEEFGRVEEARVEITTEEFGRMLLVDGCFLHSRFVPIGTPPATVNEDIRVDGDIVFLLENQLPFFVLQEIQNLISPNDALVLKSVIGRVEALVRRSEYSFARVDTLPCNLLHLLHMYFLPTILGDPARTTRAPPPATNQGAANGNGSASAPAGTPVTSYAGAVVTYMKQKVRSARAASTRTSGHAAPQITISVIEANRRWSSATYYHAAGVRLKPRKVGGGPGDARSILDVELRGSTLYVPCLTVDGNTFRMLLNLVALERSNPRLGMSHVTTYCLFLSQLAGTEKDVELLIAKKIILHLLPDAKEVALGISGICRGTVLSSNNTDRTYLREDQAKLEKLCECGWRKSRAWLRHSKCSNYFMAMGVVAAIVILVCTIVQSVFAVLGNKKGRN